MRRKDNIDIGPLVKEETLTETEKNIKEEKTQQGFLRAPAPKTKHQITRSKNSTAPNKIKIDKLIKVYNSYYLPKRNKNNSRRHFFWTKQTGTEKLENHWEKLIEIKEERNLPDFSTKIVLLKILTSITDRK